MVIRSVLFDLDGTLLDTAPDLAWALNETRAENGLPPLEYDSIRQYVSHGSFALTRIGTNASEGSANFEEFRLRLLNIYGANVARTTKPFAGIEAVLSSLESSGISWGIVTNKPTWLTQPLLRKLKLDSRAKVVVSGDTIAERKPHPAPLLLAAEMLATAPHECIYIGDAERDITAGNAAGMTTIVAEYGYISEQDSPLTWGADAHIEAPLDFCAWLATS